MMRCEGSTSATWRRCRKTCDGNRRGTVRVIRLFNVVLVVGAGLVLVLIATLADQSRTALGVPAQLTGWTLFAAMAGLALFSVRKKLSMVPVGRASYWLNAHVVIGLSALALFWVHTGNAWPSGLYEQALALLFYLLSLSGIIGYGLQRLYPARLTQGGGEVIYERIPAELARIRDDLESTLVACTEETGSDTLARHYLETMHWFFQRPRFFLDHAVSGQKGAHFVRHQCSVVSEYLSEAEQKHLARIRDLGHDKNLLDRHYALQGILKRWLLVHIPLAAGVMALAIWHLVLVHVYAL